VRPAGCEGWHERRRHAHRRPSPAHLRSYEEEASPEEFFVPYVWSVVMETSPAMTCDRGRIQIFSSAQEAPAGDKVEGGGGGDTGRGSAGERGAGDDDGAEV